MMLRSGSSQVCRRSHMAKQMSRFLKNFPSPFQTIYMCPTTAAAAAAAAAAATVRSRCGAPFFEVAAMAHPNNPIRYAYGPKWCVYHADTSTDRRTDGRRTRSVTPPQMATIIKSVATRSWIL
ncbi:unnamed protein product [Angiostrongylus costaricensis]|uniref:Uncharacterized protein n=1 Tax=Angiostrongylus costaricensis TaxID=334426 RepID=A0A0R3PNT5_ANGCS|nr:unnamed protein product [Angiostrongylus costaricensis]